MLRRRALSQLGVGGERRAMARRLVVGVMAIAALASTSPGAVIQDDGVAVGATPKAFGIFDWGVVGGYFLLLAISGWWFSRREPSGAKEYFLAGRQMPVWAVAISVVATATSAATFLGAPEEAYGGDLTYLSTNIGSVLAVIIVAAFFIPAFYKARVTTVYDLLSERFGPGARSGASWAFLIGRVMASGARLFIGAIPLSLILFRHSEPWAVVGSIWVLVCVGILYTLVGGIRSVIWTDVVQTAVFVSAVLAAAWLLLDRIPLSVPEIYRELASTPVGTGSKLTILKTGLGAGNGPLGIDFSQAYTLATAVTGFMLLMVAAYGTDHDLAQRMLTCRTSAQGSRSALLAIAVNLPVVAIFMVIGLLLHILYKRPDLMAGAAPGYTPEAGREVFLTFILREMPPGLTGLMMAGLFATGLGSFNSALNAMSAAFVNDCYTRLRPGRSDRHYLIAGRWAMLGWGCVLGSFASFCVYWQQASHETLIRFALNVMTFAYAGLLGVFLTAIFTRRGSSRSAIAALVTGFVVVAMAQPWLWKQWTARVWPSVSETKLAFPWVLVAGACAATAVCLMGKGRRKPEHETTLTREGESQVSP